MTAKPKKPAAGNGQRNRKRNDSQSLSPKAVNPGRHSRLQQELLQKAPFSNMHAEAFLNLVRTADALQRRLRLALKPYRLTETQFNALRILRGAVDSSSTSPLSSSLPCSEIGERLVSHDPDITRLLDRLERQRLIRRSRDEKDRRIVLTQITAEGLAQLKKLDAVVESCVNGMLGHLNATELHQLIHLLEQARNPKKS